MQGLKKLRNGKESDASHIYGEMLKWSGPKAETRIHRMFNQAISEGLHEEWQENWIKALYKGADRIQLTNYHTTWSVLVWQNSWVVL